MQEMQIKENQFVRLINALDSIADHLQVISASASNENLGFLSESGGSRRVYLNGQYDGVMWYTLDGEYNPHPIEESLFAGRLKGLRVYSRVSRNDVNDYVVVVFDIGGGQAVEFEMPAYTHGSKSMLSKLAALPEGSRSGVITIEPMPGEKEPSARFVRVLAGGSEVMGVDHPQSEKEVDDLIDTIAGWSTVSFEDSRDGKKEELYGSSQEKGAPKQGADAPQGGGSDKGVRQDPKKGSPKKGSPKSNAKRRGEFSDDDVQAMIDVLLQRVESHADDASFAEVAIAGQGGTVDLATKVRGFAGHIGQGTHILDALNHFGVTSLHHLTVGDLETTLKLIAFEDVRAANAPDRPDDELPF